MSLSALLTRFAQPIGNYLIRMFFVSELDENVVFMAGPLDLCLLLIISFLHRNSMGLSKLVT